MFLPMLVQFAYPEWPMLAVMVFEFVGDTLFLLIDACVLNVWYCAWFFSLFIFAC